MIKNTLRNLRRLNSVRSGFSTLNRTGKTPARAYGAMRQLYISTNGRFNDWVSRWISLRHPAREFQGNNSFIAESEISQAVKALEENGFYIFASQLPADFLTALIQFGKEQPCRPIVNTEAGKIDFTMSEKKSPYDSSVESPKFTFDAADLIANPTIQRMLMDVGFRKIAANFLRSDPILDIVDMWWSQPCGGKAHSSAAQLFHFDMDRIKFVKFFFYLTDVDTDTGPHCYIRGSSKRKPKKVLRDGRIQDADIMEVYSADDFIEICGKAGTIMAVDTRGFHKGKPLTKRNRLLLQFEMTNSMFGATYDPVPFNEAWSGEFKEFVRNNPRFFGIVG